MEYVKSQEAVKHANSPHCTAYEYPMNNGEMNIGVAEIKNRYPDSGYAINHKCSEMGYVLKGSGKLVTEKQEALLGEGDVVYIPRGEKFYWEGDLTLVLPATPAWHPEQHENIQEMTMYHSISETNGLALLSPEDRKIYSIGISTGGIAEIRMAKAVLNSKVIATTIDQAGAEFACAQIAEEQLTDKIEVKIEDVAEPLPYHDDSFDFIYGRLVLHYLPQNALSHALQELYRVLKKGGRIFVVVRSTACDAAQNGEYDPLTCMTTCDAGAYSRYFHDSASISSHLSTAGFQIVHIKEYEEQLCKDFQRTQLSEEIDSLIEVYAIKGGRTSFQ